MYDLSLKNRRKYPKEVKEKINKKIFENIIICIFITIYFMFLNLGHSNIDSSIYIIDLKVFSCALLALSIYFFEKGYKEDNEGIFLIGIEILFISFVTLCMQLRMFENNTSLELLFSLSFIYFIMYYIIKSLIQVRKIQKRYAASDVKEIVKK